MAKTKPKRCRGRIARGKGKTRDKIAAFVGVSGRTLDKIKAVVDAAEKYPERFGRLLVERVSPGRRA